MIGYFFFGSISIGGIFTNGLSGRVGDMLGCIFFSLFCFFIGFGFQSIIADKKRKKIINEFLDNTENKKQ